MLRQPLGTWTRAAVRGRSIARHETCGWRGPFIWQGFSATQCSHFHVARSDALRPRIQCSRHPWHARARTTAHGPESNLPPPPGTGFDWQNHRTLVGVVVASVANLVYYGLQPQYWLECGLFEFVLSTALVQVYKPTWVPTLAFLCSFIGFIITKRMG
mmetsp:Transcript_53517/g.143176  ORF Transcript_53517/g.143176 Transcript_53517/m.143176 type:complete len:158 (-) Transcript_53517:255-728(-)